MTDTNTNNDEKSKLKADMDESADIELGVELDDSKAKFINANGGKGLDDGEDPQVVIHEGSNDVPFTGLGKEELMRYANDPFWKKVRLILFVLFWVGWLAMLVAAIVIIVLAPRCPPRPDLKWYHTDAIYQVYTKSFKDSTTKDGNGAGIGDINGIASKLGYFDELGVNALWLSSIYQSGSSGDLDVTDHKQIDEEVGTLDDFRRLRKSTKKKGMKLILDFIPNFTSLNHTWFKGSRSRDADREDYYIWRDCTLTTKPNNWLSIYGKSAWTYDSERQQCYLHQFHEFQPDLDLTNEDVLKELQSVLRFWLDEGVDGFHVVGAPYLVENSTFADEPVSGVPGLIRENYDYLEHIYTANQPESVELIQKWRSVVDSYSKPGKERVLIVTAPKGVGNESLVYYGSSHHNGAHIVPATELMEDTTDCGNLAQCFHERLTNVIRGSNWRGWMLGDQKTQRFGSRVNPRFQMAVQGIQLTLPGTVFNYYGDEIGMPDGKGSAETDLTYASPMCWNNSKYGGFSEHEPWNSVTSDCKNFAVTVQKALFKSSYSLLESFEDLLKLRAKESFQWGKTSFGVTADELLWFTRKADGFPGFLVLANLGNNNVIPAKFSGVPSDVVLRYHSNPNHLKSVKTINLDTENIKLVPGELVILEYAA